MPRAVQQYRRCLHKKRALRRVSDNGENLSLNIRIR
ncbi:hypothetical protein Dd586_3167 [Dickeya parazeae Ech586]|uniref:Uncharacterized protein n=1 Tax=Dickeya zeae (strain Ech586) TaxID=590409 RepID=D2BUF5_DICZ5|nr:hypothetical protein Dd586_3167 [Dickeya parazeae Ech586]